MIRVFGRTFAPADLGTCLVSVEDGCIAAVEPMAERPAGVPGASHAFVVPGLIDLQLNGAFGHDFSDPGADLTAVATALPSTGVTAFLPTVVSSPPERYAPCLENLAGSTPPEGARVLGVHVEGPFLDPRHAGTHDPTMLRAPDVEEALGWLRHGDVRLVTLAPELTDALECVRALTARGVVVAIGHSGASWQQAQDALAAGARLGTHLFNAMRPLHHRDPGLIGLLLAAPVAVSVIADGRHVARETIRMVAAAKGPHHMIIVSDGLAALGLPPGSYRLAQREVISDGTVACLPDGTLSGSALPLNRALGGLVRAGVPPSLAVRAATANPARLLGRDDEIGSLVVGRAADVVLLDAGWEVMMTIIDGRIAFAALAGDGSDGRLAAGVAAPIPVGTAGP